MQRKGADQQMCEAGDKRLKKVRDVDFLKIWEYQARSISRFGCWRRSSCEALTEVGPLTAEAEDLLSSDAASCDRKNAPGTATVLVASRRHKSIDSAATMLVGVLFHKLSQLWLHKAAHTHSLFLNSRHSISTPTTVLSDGRPSL